MECKKCKQKWKEYVVTFFGVFTGWMMTEHINKKIDKYKEIKYERLRGELVERIVSRINNEPEVEVLFYEEEHMNWDKIKGIDIEKLKREYRERKAKGIEYPWSRSDHFNEEDELQIDEKGWKEKAAEEAMRWAFYYVLDKGAELVESIMDKTSDPIPRDKPQIKEKQPDPVIQIGSQNDKGIIVRHTDDCFPDTAWVTVKMEPIELDKDYKMTVRPRKKKDQEKDISVYDKNNTKGYCKGVRMKYVKAEIDDLHGERVMFKEDTFDEHNQFKIKESFTKNGFVKEFSSVSQNVTIDKEKDNQYIFDGKKIDKNPLMPFGGKFSDNPSECEQVYFNIGNNGIAIKDKREVGLATLARVNSRLNPPSDMLLVDGKKTGSLKDDIESGAMKFDMYRLLDKRSETKDVETNKERVCGIEYKSCEVKVVGDGVIEIKFRRNKESIKDIFDMETRHDLMSLRDD